MASKPRKSLNEVDAYLSRLSLPTKPLVRALRSLVRGAAAGVEEGMRWGMPTYWKNGLICYISPTRNHVTLGFYKGASLKDPEGLLQGEGKRMRQVTIEARKDIRAKQFVAWIREAAALNEAAALEEAAPRR